jgi:hypothetical protein
MAARNARNMKQPEKYAPSMKGNKYAIALTQIAASLKGSKHAMSMAQMTVKLMSEQNRTEQLKKLGNVLFLPRPF